MIHDGNGGINEVNTYMTGLMNLALSKQGRVYQGTKHSVVVVEVLKRQGIEAEVKMD